MNGKLSSNLTVKSKELVAIRSAGGSIWAGLWRKACPVDAGRPAATALRPASARSPENLSRRSRTMVARSSPRNSPSARRSRRRPRRSAAAGVAMRAACRLADDDVDDAEAHQILRGDLHVRCRVLRLCGVAPQDRRCALRRNHAVDGVLQHQHAVGGRNRDGAARAAFADDRRDIGDADGEAGLRSIARSLRLDRVPRRRCRDRRRRCRSARSPGYRNGRPCPSAAPPCDSLRAAPCRNYA